MNGSLRSSSDLVSAGLLPAAEEGDIADLSKTYATVSYTHLDVYKRQRMGCGLSACAHQPLGWIACRFWGAFARENERMSEASPFWMPHVHADQMCIRDRTV